MQTGNKKSINSFIKQNKRNSRTVIHPAQAPGFYLCLYSVLNHCHLNQSRFGQRPVDNDNGNHPMIAKNLSQHQIHCFCMWVCLCLYICVCVRGRGSPQGREEEKAWELFNVGLCRRWERGWRQKYKKMLHRIPAVKPLSLRSNKHY